MEESRGMSGKEGEVDWGVRKGRRGSKVRETWQEGMVEVN